MDIKVNLKRPEPETKPVAPAASAPKIVSEQAKKATKPPEATTPSTKKVIVLGAPIKNEAPAMKPKTKPEPKSKTAHEAAAKPAAKPEPKKGLVAKKPINVKPSAAPAVKKPVASTAPAKKPTASPVKKSAPVAAKASPKKPAPAQVKKPSPKPDTEKSAKTKAAAVKVKKERKPREKGPPRIVVFYRAEKHVAVAFKKYADDKGLDRNVALDAILLPFLRKVGYLKPEVK